MKLHICFIPYKRHIRLLIEELSKHGDVQCIFPKFLEVSRGTNYILHFLPYKSFGLQALVNIVGRETLAPRYFYGLQSCLKKIKPKQIVVFDFYHWYFLQALWFARRHPERKLFIYSETRVWPRNPVSKLFLWLMLRVLKFNDKYVSAIIVYTEAGKKFFTQYLPNVPVYLLPVGIDTNLFFPNPTPNVVEERPLRVLMNARYIDCKRHTDLFQAVALLNQRGLSIELFCIGKNGSLREQLERSVSEQGLNKRVTFLEAVNNAAAMRMVYQEHDVLVLPSDREAIGMVVPEAMACGLPTITSSAVGANSYMVEGETGFIFPVGDVEALAAHLEKCFDKEALKRMGRKASERIKQEYSLEHVTQRFIDLLEN